MLCVVDEKEFMTNLNQNSSDQRKADHIALTELAQTKASSVDSRFDYEPLFSAHPTQDEWKRPTEFLGKTLQAPLWISSMTGGTKEALTINKNLAQVAREFGLGFGLGSCRSLLESNDRLGDFDFRSVIGDELPFYANLGIAQIEQLQTKKETSKIHGLIEKLKVDGLIIHINPLQEWFQPEGDRYQKPALETIESLLSEVSFPVIVKEVGQGMGPRSLKALMKLPLAAIDFGAFGGTNFSKMELLRDVSDENHREDGLQFVGHTAGEMLSHVNQILDSNEQGIKCRSFIISGGIRSALQGHELVSSCLGNAVYAQAKPFLDHARVGIEDLRKFVLDQLLELEMAKRFLEIRAN